MKRTEVESSNIKSVGYNKKGKILEVEFKNGSIYHYRNVPVKSVQDFLEAPSIGKFFSANIRNSFDFKKGEFNEENQ